ncbi:MAG: hypothetical protein AAFV78_01430 [Bacteroidota bacterium]
MVNVIVKLNMVMGDAGQIKVLGDFFKLHFIENKGAAFGLTILSLTITLTTWSMTMTARAIKKYLLACFIFFSLILWSEEFFSSLDFSSPRL